MRTYLQKLKLYKPVCLGEYDYWGQFDCKYKYSGFCEDCVCSGMGSFDPRIPETRDCNFDYPIIISKKYGITIK